MTFSILNYLNKLEEVEQHNTWIKAQCPVCGGTLKIVSAGKKSGAFACYSGNSCEKLRPNPIVKELTKGEFKPRKSNYSSRMVRINPTIDIATPLPLNLNEIDVTQFYTNLPYEKPWSSKNELGDKITIYDYLEFQLVRIDPHNKKKFFYFRVKDANNNWANEVPTNFKNIPVYTSKYISKCVIFTEGEKVADCLQSLGLFALSFPSFVYQQSYLAKFLRCLSFRIENIIYLSDNDETGQIKAQKFLQEAWKSKINASSYNIAELLGKAEEKNYDCADAVENWEIVTREELLGILKQCSTTPY
jgi:hypothetical protein